MSYLASTHTTTIQQADPNSKAFRLGNTVCPPLTFLPELCIAIIIRVETS